MKITGSVLSVNMRLSLANGYAFADFSFANALTSYIGCKLTIIDSVGKKAVGYIKAAGTGETLGSELRTGWNNQTWAEYETLDTTGSTINSAINTSGYGGACSNELGIVLGMLLKMRFNAALSSGTMPCLLLSETSTGGGQITYGTYPTSRPSAGANTVYASAETAALYAYFSNDTGVASNFAMSGVTLTQVLTPSATGVTIVSSLDGKIRNWTSIEAGFNYNDTAGYTYEIEGIMRKLILDRIKTRMETIRTTAGYNTNLGSNVAHWRLSPWEASNLPALSIRDATNEIAPDAFGKNENKAVVELIADCSNGKTTIDQAYQIIRDIYTALALEDATTVLNGLAREMNQIGEEIDMDQQEQTIARVIIRIEVLYDTARWAL